MELESLDPAVVFANAGAKDSPSTSFGSASARFALTSSSSLPVLALAMLEAAQAGLGPGEWARDDGPVLREQRQRLPPAPPPPPPRLPLRLPARLHRPHVRLYPFLALIEGECGWGRGSEAAETNFGGPSACLTSPPSASDHASMPDLI